MESTPRTVVVNQWLCPPTILKAPALCPTGYKWLVDKKSPPKWGPLHPHSGYRVTGIPWEGGSHPAPLPLMVGRMLNFFRTARTLVQRHPLAPLFGGFSSETKGHLVKRVKQLVFPATQFKRVFWKVWVVPDCSPPGRFCPFGSRWKGGIRTCRDLFGHPLAFRSIAEQCHNTVNR